MNSNPPPRRRWLQFTMGELFLLSTFIVVPAAFFAFVFAISQMDELAHQATKARDERRFKDAIANAQAKGSSDIEFYDIHSGMDDKLAQLQPLPSVDRVAFDLTDLTDAGLRHLVRQPNLKHLSIISSPIGDNGLTHIAELTRLESLRLTNTSASDKGLAELSKFPNLHSLRLCNHFSGRDSIFTDGALDRLTACTQLRELRLEGDWFSDAAVERLRQALPDCEITVHRFEPEGRQAAQSKD